MPPTWKKAELIGSCVNWGCDMDRPSYFVVQVLSGFVWIDCGYHLTAPAAEADRAALEREHGYTATVCRRWRL